MGQLKKIHRYELEDQIHYAQQRPDGTHCSAAELELEGGTVTILVLGGRWRHYLANNIAANMPDAVPAEWEHL